MKWLKKHIYCSCFTKATMRLNNAHITSPPVGLLLTTIQLTLSSKAGQKMWLTAQAGVSDHSRCTLQGMLSHAVFARFVLVSRQQIEFQESYSQNFSLLPAHRHSQGWMRCRRVPCASCLHCTDIAYNDVTEPLELNRLCVHTVDLAPG